MVAAAAAATGAQDRETIRYSTFGRHQTRRHTERAASEPRIPVVSVTAAPLPFRSLVRLIRAKAHHRRWLAVIVRFFF